MSELSGIEETAGLRGDEGRVRVREVEMGMGVRRERGEECNWV